MTWLPGDVATIYKDPVTREHPEGQARLLHYRGGRRWAVRFLDPETKKDDHEEPVVFRFLEHEPAQEPAP